jgi:hypothetical protein
MPRWWREVLTLGKGGKAYIFYVLSVLNKARE